MTTTPPPEDEREQRLNRILLTLIQALEQGQAPDRGAFLAAHPEFAAELEEFFAGRDRLERLAAPLREAGRAAPPSAGSSDVWAHFGFSGGRATLLNPSGRAAPDRAPSGGRPSPAPDSELGTLGDFRLLREVGRGGMGVVYEAQQLSLRRRVALKVLPFAAALDPRQLQRFTNEAQAAALLHHPNIVPVHAVGSERGVHYYAMQFIDGQSLAALIRELQRSAARKPDSPRASPPPADHEGTVVDSSPSAPGAPPADGGEPASPSAVAISTEHSTRRPEYFRRVARLVRTAAEALDHAHQRGVVHRDVKPANLLLDARGDLWITDFGLALLQNNVGPTTTGELVGTLRYMSPEQASAQRGMVDHRTDVYALGVTLYELLTLEPLFESTDARHLLQQVAQDDPRPPRTLDRSIPIELETIVLKAIAKNPADRYPTARELADDLDRFLQDQPVRARRVGLLDRAVKWSRRHRPVVFSGLVLLLLATAGSLVSTVLIAGANRKVNDAYAQLNDAYKLEQQKADEARQRSEEAQKQRARAEANFTQARRAVDFLTEVSAEELVDRPEALGVRRKLLEGALQYYQEFIDQHQGDPSLPELTASRARVAQILADLSAQDDYFRLMLRTMLLGEKAVQEDLHVTPAQEEKIAALSGRLAEPRRGAFFRVLKLPEKERMQRFKEMAAADEQAMAAVLTPAQAKRLKQIALQQRGPEAFGEPETAGALHLAADEKKHIQVLLDQGQKTIQDTCRPGMHPGEMDPKIREAGNRTRDAILALLTPEQKAAWKEMTGEPFKGRIHFPPPIGFGPEGRGHDEHHPPGPPPGPRGGRGGGRPPPPDDHHPDGPERIW